MIRDGVLVLMERGPKPKNTSAAASTNSAAANAAPRLPDESVRGFDAATGRELWRTNYPCDTPAEGHNYYWGSCATPAGVTGRAVCQFLDGKVRCLALKSGELLWETDMAAEYGMTKKGGETIFQACSSPLVAGDLVIVEVCAGEVGLVALRAADGKEAWRTPVFSNYGSSTGSMKIGDRQVVIAMPCYVDRKLFKGGDVLGFDAQSGELVWWGNAEKSYYNAPAPIANEGIVVVEGGSGDGPTYAFAPPATGAGPATNLWRDADHLARFSNYLVYRGLVFGQGFHAHPRPAIGKRLFCLDASTGAAQWDQPVKEQHHSMIGSDGKVLQFHENGELSLFDADARAGYRELARARVVAQTGKTWSFPALVRGKFYVRTDGELVCLDLAVGR